MHATRLMFECYDPELTPLGPIIAAIDAARPFTREVIVHTSVSQWHSVLSTIRNACPDVRQRPGLKASPVALLSGDESTWTRYCYAMGEASRFCDSGDVWMEIESWYAAQEQAGRSSEWWSAWVERLSLMSVRYERVWAHHPTVLWDGRRDAVVKMIAEKIPNFHWVFAYDAQPMLQDGEDARRLRMLEIVGADRCASHAYVTTPKVEVNDWKDHWPMGMLSRALLREESRFLPVHPVSLYLGSGGGDANEDGVPDRAQAMTRLAKLLRKRGATKGHVPGMESIRENQDRPAPLREADVAEMEAHAKTCACNHDYLVRLIAAYRDLQGKLGFEYNDSRGLNSLFKSAAEERDAIVIRYESLSTRHWTCNKCGGQWFCDRAEVPTVSGNHKPCKMCPWCEKQFILDDAIELAGYVHDLIALAQGRPIRTARQETMLETASKYFDNSEACLMVGERDDRRKP